MDISNGIGSGVSVFFSGCDFNCRNCFNKELQDYNYGNEFTDETIEEIIELLDKPYIIRLSLLGGDALMPKNVMEVLRFVKIVKERLPHKKIWLYSGFTYEQVMNPIVTCDINIERDRILDAREELLSLVDIFVDGRYVDELRDMSLKFRGSSNQRVIDVQETIKQGKIVLALD